METFNEYPVETLFTRPLRRDLLEITTDPFSFRNDPCQEPSVMMILHGYQYFSTAPIGAVLLLDPHYRTVQDPYEKISTISSLR